MLVLLAIIPLEAHIHLESFHDMGTAPPLKIQTSDMVIQSMNDTAGWVGSVY